MSGGKVVTLSVIHLGAASSGRSDLAGLDFEMTVGLLTLGIAVSDERCWLTGISAGVGKS
jgi:hypothetical protein